MRTASGRKSRALGAFEQEILDLHNMFLDRYGEEGRLEALEYIGLACGSRMCVYFVRMGSTPAYKIGIAYDAESRIKNLQTHSPLKLKFKAWINSPTRESLLKVEREAHRLAGIYGAKAHGEWFNLDEGAVRKIIDGVISSVPEHVMGVNYDI